ncbi:MAG: phage minor tail protein L [Comamonas sp.]|jgi:lambda family phage minor tail protein L|nr:phage minor tail protein L [Comamonas sp.]
MITADIQGLAPGERVQVFELDATQIGGEVLRFHGYPQVGAIVWQGKEYSPWAIEAAGFARTGTGTQPAPTLRVGNIGQDEQGNPLPGVISALCLALRDLVGARVIRRCTLGKYLDAANFPEGNPAADPNEEFPPEIWLIEAKTAEDKETVEFELSSALSFDGEQLPARQIQASSCGWLSIGGYRGPYCGYTGAAIFDRDGNPVADPTQDKCGGRVSDCKKRFGEWEPINFGGFPGADLIRGY